MLRHREGIFLLIKIVDTKKKYFCAYVAENSTRCRTQQQHRKKEKANSKVQQVPSMYTA
jgi:hypothetical protein